MTVELAGGCACGSVRYRLSSEPIITHGCHCRLCQRMSGSAFAVNAMIEADRVVSIGPVAPDIVHTPSALPDGQRVHRCPRCMVALWSNHALLGPAIALVNAGTLDHAERCVPDVHCFTATKHPWITIPADAPSFPADYDSDQIWSSEAKTRLAAAMSSGRSADVDRT